MHSHDPSTPPPKASDSELASAFRDLEGAVADLRNMACVVDIVAEDTVYAVEGFIEKHVRANSGLKGYRIFVLTEDQASGLDYVLRHFGDLSRDLYKAYYAGFERKAA